MATTDCGRQTGAHHFFVAPDDIEEDRVVIRGEEAHHAARVLRVRPGEVITVADDSGRIVDAVVTDVSDNVSAEVSSARFVEAPRPALTLFQAITKGDRMDDVVTKAVELGVDAVVPFVAERTIVRWDDSKRTKTVERWTAVARAAAKQCSSARLTTVGDVLVGPKRALEHDGPVIVLHERATTPLREILPGKPPGAMGLVVGPEGGLSPSELRAMEGGANVVSLGDRVLRTETAGLVAAAIIRYVYGSLG